MLLSDKLSTVIISEALTYNARALITSKRICDFKVVYSYIGFLNCNENVENRIQEITVLVETENELGASGNYQYGVF